MNTLDGLKQPKQEMPASSNPRDRSAARNVIRKLEECVYEVRLPKHRLYLVGTAHVSKESVDLVERMMDKYAPGVVYLELDEQRRKALVERKFKEINLIEIIRQKKVAFFISYLLLSIFQKKIADQVGAVPGGEFKKALELSSEKGIRVVLIDREAGITVKRLWRRMRLMEQLKLLFTFFLPSRELGGFFEKMEDIEKFKHGDVITKMVEQVAKKFPTVKEVIIEERDAFMVEKILQVGEKETTDLNKKPSSLKQNKVDQGMVVVGAGHLAGMLDRLQKRINSKKSPTVNIEELNQIPPVQMFWKYLPWVLTSLILSLFTVGFFYADPARFQEALLYWILINGSLSALGGVIALAHPITIIACFVAAPITSLNPMIGAGMVTGLVQTLLLPPQVIDFENFSSDALSVRRWWKNRITKVLLVFVLSSLGSGIGTWLALSVMIEIFY